MSPLARALLPAVVSTVAVLASFGVTYAICSVIGAGPSPAILAAALSVGLMPRNEPVEARSLVRKLALLPLIALAAGLVGATFLKAPPLGAALFTVAVALSVWLRQFGDVASAVGRTIALPLVAILVAPVHVSGAHGKLIPALLLLAAGAIATASTSAVAWLAANAGLAAEEGRARRPSRPVRAAQKGQLPVATRMALQMFAALALAFTIGMLAFGEHWPWVVLTSFIVSSGAIGRGDAIYKGLLRLGGAIGGTLVAAVVSHVTFPNATVDAAVIFLVLFVGIWLRQINYAYWAACATLIFALLQGSQGLDAVPLFGVRVLGILIGALCGVAATWFVYPIRTEQVVRRRIADALPALREVLGSKPTDPEHQARVAMLDVHAAELERVAPPVRLHRAVFGAKAPDEHPATWIDLMHRLLAQARTPGFDRAHVGAEMRRLGAMVRNPANTKQEAPPDAGTREAR